MLMLLTCRAIVDGFRLCGSRLVTTRGTVGVMVRRRRRRNRLMGGLR